MNARFLVASGALAYLATLVVVPLANPSLDQVRLHPEDFASGTLGFLVSVGYVALAAAAIAAAVIALRVGGVASWMGAACFLIAAAMCVANAIDPTLGARRSPIEIGVFGLLVGPVLLALRLGDRALIVSAISIAIGFAALLAAPESVGGVVNRVMDALIGIWFAVFARRAPRAWGGIMRTSGEVA